MSTRGFVASASIAGETCTVLFWVTGAIVVVVVSGAVVVVVVGATWVVVVPGTVVDVLATVVEVGAAVVEVGATVVVGPTVAFVVGGGLPSLPTAGSTDVPTRTNRAVTTAAVRRFIGRAFLHLTGGTVADGVRDDFGIRVIFDRWPRNL